MKYMMDVARLIAAANPNVLIFLTVSDSSQSASTKARNKSAGMYDVYDVCMYVCVYVCMYLCMYACVYIYMYVCMRPANNKHCPIQQHFSGFFFIMGPKELVKTVGPEVAKILEGRGGGKNGRFQGKANRIERRHEVLKYLNTKSNQATGVMNDTGATLTFSVSNPSSWF